MKKVIFSLDLNLILWKNHTIKLKHLLKNIFELAKDVNGGELIENLKQHLPTNSTVLEIGSGPGTDWKILQEIYSTIGSDNSDEFLTHLTQQNPEGEFLKLDAATLITQTNI